MVTVQWRWMSGDQINKATTNLRQRKVFNIYINAASDVKENDTRHTRSNWLQLDAALQSVATCMGVSCSQSQISDSVRYFLRRSVALQVVAACMPESCKLQVQEPMKTCFTSFIFSPMMACRSVALQVVAASMCSSFRYLRRRVAVSCYVYAGLKYAVFKWLCIKYSWSVADPGNIRLYRECTSSIDQIQGEGGPIDPYLATNKQLSILCRSSDLGKCVVNLMIFNRHFKDIYYLIIKSHIISNQRNIFKRFNHVCRKSSIIQCNIRVPDVSKYEWFLVIQLVLQEKISEDCTKFEEK